MNKYFSGYKKKFFQGWYFKQSGGHESIAFIPGYAVSADGARTAFIQTLTARNSFYTEYPIERFKAARDKLEIRIGNSVFSEEGLALDIDGGIRIKGDLEFSAFNPPRPRFLSGNIMGLFEYLPFMECKHHIYSLHHEVNGVLTVNSEDIVFNGAKGYCEGDRGISFPKGYMWFQSNLFGGPDSCVSVSIADVPYLGMNICGLAAVFKHNGAERRFATYNGTKIAVLEDRGDVINIVLTRGGDELCASVSLPLGFALKAPSDGLMKNTVKEALSASLSLKVTADKKVIFDENGIICSAENVGKVRCMSYEPIAQPVKT